jgi:hypothetical protein
VVVFEASCGKFDADFGVTDSLTFGCAARAIDWPGK